MMRVAKLLEEIRGGAFDGALCYLYGAPALQAQRGRYLEAVERFGQLYGTQHEAALYSVPGRTEVGGNHTDHQRGRVLAAGVNLDAVAVAARSGEGFIRIESAGYPKDEIRTCDLSVKEGERNRAAALIRGVAARMADAGYRIGGVNAYTTSDVLGGSGLSSSAAFEVLVGSILNGLFNESSIPAMELAQIGQYAENEYFGKPSGLMDQAACAVGGFVEFDFEDAKKPRAQRIPFDFAHSGYHLCIVDTKGDHADLTGDYAAIPEEMRSVAAFFGKQVLREVPKKDFFANLRDVYGKVSNRAVARAIHFYRENDRVQQQADALRGGDMESFLRLVTESGRSSAMYLQNLFPASSPAQQGLTVALALSEGILSGQGAWRVHGGGFAGTIQAFVPQALLGEYVHTLDGVYGEGSCHVLTVRPIGLCEVTPQLGANAAAQ